VTQETGFKAAAAVYITAALYAAATVVVAIYESSAIARIIGLLIALLLTLHLAWTGIHAFTHPPAGMNDEDQSAEDPGPEG